MSPGEFNTPDHPSPDFLPAMIVRGGNWDKSWTRNYDDLGWSEYLPGIRVNHYYSPGSGQVVVCELTFLTDDFESIGEKENFHLMAGRYTTPVFKLDLRRYALHKQTSLYQ